MTPPSPGGTGDDGRYRSRSALVIGPGVPPLGPQPALAADAATAHLADGGDRVVSGVTQVGGLAVADAAG